MMTHYLSLTIYVKIPVFYTFLKDFFSEYWWCSIDFTLSYFLKLSAIITIFVCLNEMCLFSLAHKFSFTLVLSNLVMLSLCMVFFIFILLGSLKFLDLCIHSSHQIWKILGNDFFRYFITPSSSSLFELLIYMINLIFSYMSQRFVFFFNPFPFCDSFERSYCYVLNFNIFSQSC